VVVGAVTYLYVGSRGAYRGNEGLARIQEGRFAIDSITRDIRRSGALGCGSRLSASNGLAIQVKMSVSRWWRGAANAIQGFAPANYTPLPATAPQLAGPRRPRTGEATCCSCRLPAALRCASPSVRTPINGPSRSPTTVCPQRRGELRRRRLCSGGQLHGGHRI